MLRKGALTFGDIAGCLAMFDIYYRKCDRRGRYHVESAYWAKRGRDTFIVGRTQELTADWLPGPGEQAP